MAWTRAKTTMVTGGGVWLAVSALTFIVYTLSHLTKVSPPVHLTDIPPDWSSVTGGRDQWSWTNDTLCAHTTTGDAILASTRQYGDVTLSAMASTTNREASLALRFQDADNGYLAVFVPDYTPGAGPGGSRILLVRRQSGQEKELAIFKRHGIAGPGQFEKITFAAKGSKLEVRLNDVPVIKTNDTAFASGYLGLRAYGDPNIPCDAVFANVTIRE